MEMIHIDVSGQAYHEAVHAKNALPECGDLRLLVKPHATAGDQPGVVIAFNVRLPDGAIATAQAVTTWRLLKHAVAGLSRLLPE